LLGAVLRLRRAHRTKKPPPDMSSGGLFRCGMTQLSA
jgi:hypothetical protein